MLASLMATSASSARNLYWVGGSASWDGTAGSKWASASGGAGGLAVPTAVDNVFIDGNSGAVTVTMATAVGNCGNLDFTGFTGTFAGSTGLNIYGSLTLAAGMTMSYDSSTFKMKSTNLGKTITYNGKKINSLGIIFDGVGGGWILQDAFNGSSSASGSITLTNGNLNTNNQPITIRTITVGGTGCALTLGSSVIVVGIQWTIDSAATFSAGTSSITIATAFISGGLTYNTVILNSTSAGGTAMNGTATFNNLTRSNTSGYTALSIADNITINTSLTMTGNDAGGQRILIQNGGVSPFTIPITITCNGSISLTNVDFQGIVGAGSATWSGTSIGDALLNSGITFTTPVTRYLVCPTGAQDFMTSNIWATSSGGANNASKPLPQDTIIIDANSFLAGASNLSSAYRIPGMDFTSAANSPTFTPSAANAFYGSVKLISAMTLTGPIAMSGYGQALTVTSGTQTNTALSIKAGTGSVTLGDAMTSSGAITLTNGTFSDAGFAVQGTVFTSIANATRALTKTGNWTLTSTGVIWNVSGSGLTINDTAGTIKFNNNSSSSKTFAGAGFTYHNFYNNTLGTGVCNITGSNTFADFKSDQNRTNQFTAGTTATIATITATGASSNIITFGGITAANYNIVSNSGTAINTDWISISHCQFSGATWHAGANSTDGGNNSGITFP